MSKENVLASKEDATVKLDIEINQEGILSMNTNLTQEGIVLLLNDIIKNIEEDGIKLEKADEEEEKEEE